MSFGGSSRFAGLDVLLVGYGNTLRGDDGVGPAVVDRVGESASCRTLLAHQLMPEHAEELGRAHVVVFVDASVRLEPGEIAIRHVAALAPRSNGLTHHVSPEALLWIARTVYGHEPEALAIEIGGGDFSAGGKLSPVVGRAADRVVRHLKRRFRRRERALAAH